MLTPLCSLQSSVETTECPTSTPLHPIEGSSAPFDTLQGHWGAQNQPTHSIMEQQGQVTLKLNKTQKERKRTQFVYRTARVVNRIHEKVDFNCEVGLKNRIINLMWLHVENRFSENNVCTWKLCCECGSNGNNWTNFWTDSGGIGPSRPTGNPKHQKQQQQQKLAICWVISKYFQTSASHFPPRSWKMYCEVQELQVKKYE